MENNEPRDEMPYTDEPKSDFQHFIRMGRDGESTYFACRAIRFCCSTFASEKYQQTQLLIIILKSLML